MSNAQKISKEEAQAKSKYHGASRSFAGYDEAVTALRHLRADWGAAEMYKDGQGFIVYAWYDHDGRVKSGREQ
jgi:hypothetical protein